jgi:class 3 adenylate cyclase
VVNLASRLEGMTRWFGGSILLDEETVNQVRNQPHHWNLQRLGNFLPFGLQVPAQVHRLVPDDSLEDHHHQIKIYDQALQQFESGDWEAAIKLLSDRVDPEPCGTFLLKYMQRKEFNATPPTGFKGVIEMNSK